VLTLAGNMMQKQPNVTNTRMG